MTKREDQKAWKEEWRSAAVLGADCKCGHMKCQHIDYGHDGPCALNDCECKAFEKGRKRAEKTSEGEMKLCVLHKGQASQATCPLCDALTNLNSMTEQRDRYRRLYELVLQRNNGLVNEVVQLEDKVEVLAGLRKA